MKVLITGGTGNLGAETAHQLVETGHRVVAFDVAPQPQGLQRLLGERSGEVAVVQGDISDLDQLTGAVHGYAVDTIVHLAALLGDDAAANPTLAVKVNCIGTANVFEVARLASVRRVVWSSSAAVYNGYPHELHPREDTPPCPTNLYGATKVVNEQVAERFVRNYGLDVIGIRYPYLNGPYRRRGVATQVLTELVAKPVLGQPGRVTYADDAPNWLWIGDAARAAVLAVEVENHRQRIYNINGDVRSIRECAAYVLSRIPSAQFTYEPGVFGFYHNPDSSAIERDLGFVREWPMEAQFDRLIELFRADRSIAARLVAMGPI